MKRLPIVLIVLLSLWIGFGIIPLGPLISPASGSRVLLDERGKLLNLSLSQDDKYRLYQPLSQISPQVVKATLLYEDQSYYYHPGVNPFSLIRGAIQTIRNPDRPVGGSTITMQVARLRYGINTKGILGKLYQIAIALVLERQFSKDEILEGYLNLAPYGANVEGVAAASLIYYHKQAIDLDDGEALTLAVLPQSPSARWKNSGHDSLDRARAELARRWEKKFDVAPVAQDLIYSPRAVPNIAPHFFSRIRSLRLDKLTLESNIKMDLQIKAEEIMREHLNRYSELGINNGTVLIAELPDLKVRAYVGSAQFGKVDIQGFVNGLASQRSPGSLLKPFVYALAIDQGKILPETMLHDLPLRLASYRPENFERNFLGPISARDALVRSRNIPALEVYRKLKPNSFHKFLTRSGVSKLKSDAYYGIALVLGGLGISSEEIAQLYGIIGNGGKATKLGFLRDDRFPKVSVLSKESAFIVKDMLAGNPAALTGFKSYKIPWKTGTSYGSRDAWAAGLVGNYIVVVWLGNFDGKPNPNLVGRDVAGPVFFSLVENLYKEPLGFRPSVREEMNLQKVEVCALSGQIANEDCPHRKESWFIRGVSPIASCNVHQRFEIDPRSGERLCPGEQGGITKVFEVWKSDMLDFYSKAGLGRAVAPPYRKSCSAPSNGGRAIRIVSPESHVTYHLESQRELELELVASAPGDAKLLTWFVGDELVGQIEPRKPLFWSARRGNFAIRAVDDLGRSGLVNIKVIGPQS